MLPPKVSEKVQLTAAPCNELYRSNKFYLCLLWASKFATGKIEFSFEMGK